MQISTAASHDVAIYATDEFVTAKVTEFIAAGLAVNQQVLVVATSPRWSAIAERLDEVGVAHGQATARGQLVIADAASVLEDITVDGKPSAERFREMLESMLDGSRPVRIYGELVALLAAQGNFDAAEAIESMGHALAHERQVPILCGYPATAFALTPERLARVRALHDHAVVENDPKLAAGRFHAVQFYKDSPELAEIVTEFLAEGLTLNQPGLVIATSDHRQRLQEGLQARGLDLDRLLATKRLVLVDATETLQQFMVDGMPDSNRFETTVVPLLETITTQHPHRTIRAYGEMVNVLWSEGHTVAATRLEMLWNGLAKTHRFALLCGYSMGNFYKNADVADICGHHSRVVKVAADVTQIQ